VRRIVTAVASTITAVVLLFSYHTSTGSGSSQAATSVARSASQHAGSASAGGDTSGSGSDRSTSAGTYTGDEVSTEWGIVQVELTVQGGKITSANAVRVPDGNHRDQEINSYAVPVLNQEVLDAQDAGIDTVSGATVTSDGYIQSLQSALDAAHLS
jgi:uncharacterized protein with FMN-binding domain